MGDITEMMEEGMLCSICGVYLEGDDNPPFSVCDDCAEAE